RMKNTLPVTTQIPTSSSRRNFMDTPVQVFLGIHICMEDTPADKLNLSGFLMSTQILLSFLRGLKMKEFCFLVIFFPLAIWPQKIAISNPVTPLQFGEQDQSG